MKGVVLAGGTGSRLYPLTKSINKHCLPIYDRPMVYYPIQTLVKAGIKDIILVAGGNHMSQFIDLLGDGSELGCNISYVAQMQPGGIAEAISIVQPFTRNEDICVILGDNIFEGTITNLIKRFYERASFGQGTCAVMCKQVDEPQHYGVLGHHRNGEIIIEEKPVAPLSNLAITGLYIYTDDVFKKIKELTPSARGELEVSDLNQKYAKGDNLIYEITKETWFDCGVDIDHMLECSQKVKELK